MATALLIVGILCLLTGLLWIGQGTGFFPYPAASFMVNELTWAYRGGALAAAGVIAIIIARRIAT